MRKLTGARLEGDRRRLGFSLAELLVVIGLIAMLIALLLPALSRARWHAQRLSCASNMRLLAMAWASYAEDHHGQLVGAECDQPYDWVIEGADGPASAVTNGLLFPYSRQQRIYHCPTDDEQHPWSYSLDFFLNGTSPEKWWNNDIAHKLSQVRRSSEALLFVEEHDPRAVANEGSWLCGDAAFRAYIDADWVESWHRQSTNVAFVDGHVETWPLVNRQSDTVQLGSIISTDNADRKRFWTALSDVFTP